MIKSLIFSLLCAPVAAPALTLVDFSFANHEAFVARFERGETATCDALVAVKRVATGPELVRAERELRRATSLVEAWRAAAVGAEFFAARRAEINASFERLIEFRTELILPKHLGTGVARAVNELRFLETYRGFVATEVELEKWLASLLAQSARLKFEARYLEDDVARFMFELTVMRGQEYMLQFKRSTGLAPFDARRIYRAERIDILQRNAIKFGRLVNK